MQKIETDIRNTVDEATKKAKADKEIGLDEITGDIYAAPLEPTVRGVAPWNRLPHKSIGKPANF